MFLLRMMFWLVVVILLLPTGEEASTTQPSPAGKTVTVTDAVDAASVAMTDMADFCDRNRSVCDTGVAAWSVFWQKAEYGARLVYRLARDAMSGNESDDGDSVEVRDAVHTGTTIMRPSRDTLTDSDLQVPWRGPSSGDA